MVQLLVLSCGIVSCAGLVVGHKVVGLKMVLEDGVSHSVDSSENAFKAAAMGAMRTCEGVGGGGRVGGEEAAGED